MNNGIITEFDSKEVMKVRMRFGAEGYLAYVAIQELLYRHINHALERNYDAIAAAICVDVNLVKGVIEQLDLFVLSDTHFVSISINAYFERKRKLSESKARGGYARWGKKQEANARVNDANASDDGANAKEEGANANQLGANAQKAEANALSGKRKEPKENILLFVSEETNECENKKTPEHAPANDDGIDWKWLREQLVLIFQGTKIPKPNSTFSEGRKKHIRARIAEVGIDRFLEVMKKAANSTFLTKTCTFNISLSWLVNPQNFEKISEGTYDDKPSEIQSYIEAKTQEYKIGWDSVVTWFNNCGLIQITALTDERKYLFLKAYELGGDSKAEKDAALKKFKAEVKASDCLQGIYPNSKKRDFDWCFDRRNFLRILEGTYNNDTYNKTEKQYGTSKHDPKRGAAAPDPRNAADVYGKEVDTL